MALLPGTYKNDIYFQNDPLKYVIERLLPVMNGNLSTGFIPIDIFASRIILSNDFADETVVNTGGSEKASGGILALDGAIFSLNRVNAATDKAARVVFKANTTGEIQFPTIPLPHDLDDTADMTVNLWAGMGGATNTPVIDVQAFFNVGDTECGGNIAALSATAGLRTVTLAAADVPAAPGFLNLALVPAAHADDAIHLYAAWITYTRKAF